MDDEFLRSLWQRSEEDSFFDYWDPEAKEARKEVMTHLVEMMSEVPCPKEGESTSNLYRILVKKLREQISDFDSNPEVVDRATKKLAKWVENVVKEAYYRKQGRITSAKKVQEEREIDKTQLQVINPEKDLPKSEHVKEMQENILKKERNEEKYSEFSDDNDTKLGVKIRKRPKIIYKQKEYPTFDDKRKLATSSSEMESSHKHNLRSIPTDESDLITQTKNLRIQDERVVVIKPDSDHVYIVDQEVQVSKDLLHDTEKRGTKSNFCVDQPPVCRLDENSASLVDDTRSSNRLVKNWSSWMVNLTRKARSLVKWENSMMDQLENSEVKEPTKSDIAMQEKWKKLVAENEAKKIETEPRTSVEQKEQATSGQKTPPGTTSKNKTIRTENN